MVMPIGDPHPRGYANPVTLRANAALAAAGAWDAAPTESFSTNANEMSLHFVYLRGAAGGAFDWQLEISHYATAALVPVGAGEFVTMSLYAPGPVAAGVDSQSRIQREYITYVSQAAPAEDFVFTVQLDKVIERLRIRCRESVEGVQGTPGSVQITAVLV